MSRGPNVEGIRSLREIAKRRAEIKRELLAIREVVSKAESLRDELAVIGRKAIKIVEEMDCKATGNTGRDSRFLLMLEGIVNGSDLIQE